jgi:hypothetical protein
MAAPFGSVEEAVTPTAVPAGAASATVLGAGLASTGVVASSRRTSSASARPPAAPAPARRVRRPASEWAILFTGRNREANFI